MDLTLYHTLFTIHVYPILSYPYLIPILSTPKSLFLPCYSIFNTHSHSTSLTNSFHYTSLTPIPVQPFSLSKNSIPIHTNYSFLCISLFTIILLRPLQVYLSLSLSHSLTHSITLFHPFYSISSTHTHLPHSCIDCVDRAAFKLVVPTFSFVPLEPTTSTSTTTKFILRKCNCCCSILNAERIREK